MVMVISKENKEFIDSLIDYYINESEAYTQFLKILFQRLNLFQIQRLVSLQDIIFRIFTGISKSATNSKPEDMRIQRNNKKTSSLDKKGNN